ncbi:tetratricopeptide repeat protein 37-like [Amphiura filiformis]|uniref:tetratricopeptide repeat protein 37-like n=1 Tax=Amphiura filiformis TaxID=82378 RepID=UPI003B214EB4
MMATGGGSNKEIKSLLKSAREAIRNKEYKEALKHCKGVLKQDKGNYNALVFIGIAAGEMGQPDQAVMAYKKAIETDSQQLLAWQGLSGFYEKSEKEEHKPELIGTYKSMLDILQGKDQKKWTETAEKLVQVCIVFGNIKEALTYLKSLIDEASKTEGDPLTYWKQVADILVDQKTLTEENTVQLQQAYMCILHSSDLDQQDHLKYYSGYIKHLQKSGVDDSEVIKECEKMHELFPNEVLPLQGLAKIYLKCQPGEFAQLLSPCR